MMYRIAARLSEKRIAGKRSVKPTNAGPGIMNSQKSVTTLGVNTIAR
jgi:hypothetical protein